jgi:hypothetical protein
MMMVNGHSMKSLQRNMGCCELKDSFQLQVKANFSSFFGGAK